MSVIILTGGGTAGHCIPCFALLPDLKKSFDEIYYVGDKDKIESKLAEKHGVTFFYAPTVKLERRLTPKNALIPIKLLKAIAAAKGILKNLKPDVVFSKGGYVALPVVIAAHKLGIPVVSHESDLSIGLANKIALRYSAKLLTGFPPTAENIAKAEYTGIPLDKNLFKPREKGRLFKKYGFDDKKRTILITGGSQGSAAINNSTESCIENLAEKYNVLWLAGKGKSSHVKIKNVYCAEFCENMGEAYAIADVCVSRAGANTLFELIALGIPTLAIPLPKGNSRGDQVENAAYFKKKGLISVLTEDKLTPESLEYSIGRLFENGKSYTAACKKLDLRSANERVLSYLNKYARHTKKTINVRQ